MMVSISLRPGGPFAKPRRVAYFLLYLSLVLVSAGVMLAEVWADKKRPDDFRLYFRLENTFAVFFCFWGAAVTLNDQLGGNGLTVYNYIILMTAILSAMKPWQTSLLFFVSFVSLNWLLPYFPDPNGLDNSYNNFMNSFFLFIASSAVAAILYRSKIQAKKDEFIIKEQYIQIEEANKMLSREALRDALTNLQNRNCYKKAVQAFAEAGYDSFACIYIDVNGLHEINNSLGHQAGDAMLKTVAVILLRNFGTEEIFRIGGDEFVVLCGNVGKEQIENRTADICREAEEAGYSLSVGLEWRETDLNVREMVQAAEAAMQIYKKDYYTSQGGERQRRDLNRQLERIISLNKDVERFLSVMAPVFKGVYVVNLEADTLRQIFIPDYFMEMLEETGGSFSKALKVYSQKMVEPEYQHLFEQFCDYSRLAVLLEEDEIPGFTYQRNDGSRLMLRVLKFNHYSSKYRETLWMFSDIK